MSRLASLDNNSTPFVNKHRNPSIQAAAFNTTGERYRNLVSNSSFETVNAAQEYIRNFFLNPRAASSVGFNVSWVGNANNAWTTGSVASTDSISGTAHRWSWSVKDNTTGDIGPHFQGSGLSANGIYTVKYKLKAIDGGTVGAPGVFATSGAMTLTARSRPAAKTFAAGEVETIWVSFTIDSTATTANPKIINGITGTGAQSWEIFDVVCTNTNWVPDYFDGQTKTGYWNHADWTPAWSSTVNNSVSVLRAIRPTNVTLVSGNRIAVGSTEVVSTGRSLRVTPRVLNNNSTTNDTFANISDAMPSPTTMAGRQYTIISKVRIVSAAKGTVGRYCGFRISVATPSGAVEPTINMTQSVPSNASAGVYSVRATFTMPSDVTGWNHFRLYTGTAYDATTLNDDIFWDDIGLFEGDYYGPYFDGNSVGNNVLGPWGLNYTYSWAGTANNSQTICNGPVGLVECFRNYVPNPKAAVDANNITTQVGTGGAVTTSRYASGGPIANCSYYEALWTTGATAGNVGVVFSMNYGTAPVNTYFAGSIWVRSNVAIEAFAMVDIQDSSGTYLNLIRGSTVSLAANTWTRLSVTGQITIANASRANLIVRKNTVGTNANDTIHVSCAQMTTGTSVLLDYFDGDLKTGYFADSDFQSGWSAKVNGSESFISGVMNGGSMTTGGGGRTVIQSMRNGKKYVRIVPLTTGGTSAGSLLGFIGNMEIGRKYTVYATLTLFGTPSLLDNSARSIFVFNQTPTVRSDLAPNAPGVTRHRVSFIAQSTDGTSIRLSGTGGAVGVASNESFWSDIIIYDGDGPDMKFDGDQPGAVWRGPAHNSESVMYKPAR